MKLFNKKLFILLLLITIFFFMQVIKCFCATIPNYQCNMCNSTFVTPGKKVEHNILTGKDEEVSVCPHCKNKNIRTLTSSEKQKYSDQQKIEEWKAEGKSDSEIEKLQILVEQNGFVSMISEIFSVNNDSTNIDEDSNNIFSTYNLMMDIRKVLISSLQKFNSSSLYILFCFVGTLFVVINYSINFYQSSYNFEGKTIEQYIRLSFQVIFSLFLVYASSRLSEFFLNFFGYILDFVWGFTKSGTLVINQPSELGFTPAQDIAYDILVEEGLAASSKDVLKFFVNSISIMWLKMQFFIPWIVSMLGKFGVLFAILSNAIELLVHCFLLPIAAGDVNENIRQSKLIKFSKHIMASALNLSVIVLIILAIQVISYDFVQEMFDKARSIGGRANITQLAFIMAIIQVVKAVACNSTAKQISGRVFGE